jgi:hypothetical protein
VSDSTHYRKVFKSDHLGVADIEDLRDSGSDLIFTIKHVKQEWGVKVAGKKGNHNIAYFVEDIKPWVLNAGNCVIMKGFSGSIHVAQWNNISVRLYIDPSARFGGEVTGGVRIHPEQPVKAKIELLPKTKAWDNAKIAFKRDGNLNKVKARMTISKDNELLLAGECQ